MALYGILADIHGNREALAAALAALDERGAQRIACLGDVVGYNADPDECAALLRERRALAIAGNHDLISLGRLSFARCSNKAAFSIKRTRRSLRKETAAWLATLPPYRVLEAGVVLVHGGVRDVQQYMTTPAHIAENARYLAEDFPGARVCFFGHSHEQKVYEVHGDEVKEIPANGKVLLGQAHTYFVNPGSVDASRKSRHKLAEFAIFESAAGELEFARVPYDCAATEAKAAVFGYRIDPLTDRLYDWQRRFVKIGMKLIGKAGRIPILRRSAP
jgi:predicted phosphodiesterase